MGGSKRGQKKRAQKRDRKRIPFPRFPRTVKCRLA